MTIHLHAVTQTSELFLTVTLPALMISECLRIYGQGSKMQTHTSCVNSVSLTFMFCGQELATWPLVTAPVAKQLLLTALSSEVWLQGWRGQ